MPMADGPPSMPSDSVTTGVSVLLVLVGLLVLLYGEFASMDSLINGGGVVVLVGMGVLTVYIAGLE